MLAGDSDLSGGSAELLADESDLIDDAESPASDPAGGPSMLGDDFGHIHADYTVQGDQITG